ncbi:hypothetical protein PT974_01681 [Cladobotryum mycophilum]|uniref:Uncharacterized protein n=1 Tax=Cladobotryum mycophilum TaxID=491253 RepID=A0ABR0SWT0_9HYPO
MLPTSDVITTIAGLAAYELVQVFLHTFTKRFNPSFYATLHKDPSFKLRPYFVFISGIALTIFTTPICLNAYTSTPADTDIFGHSRGFSSAEKICLSSRGVLWIAELPLLTYSTEIVTHHILALSSLATILVTNFPRRPLYLIYAGLITELFSDSFCMLRIHGQNAENSKTFRICMLSNAFALILLRVIPITAFIMTVFMPAADIRTWVYTAAIAFYCGYMLYCSYLQLSVLGYIKLVKDRPAYLQIMGKYHISLYSMLFGTAMVAAQASTIAMFRWSRDEPLTDGENRSLAIMGLGAAATGLLGATLLYPAFEDRKHSTSNDIAPAGCSVGLAVQARTTNITIQGGPSGPLSQPPLRSGCTIRFAIQGGILSAACFLLSSLTLSPIPQKPALLSAMALSLPLGESIGRVGCHYAGCCGSKLHHGKENHGPVQLLSSTMNMAAFAVLSSLVLKSTLSLYEAGALAILANASIRLSVDPLRESGSIKGNKLPVTTRFALGQLFLSCILLAGIELTTMQNTIDTITSTMKATLLTLLTTYFARTAWATLMQRMQSFTHLAPLVRPLTAVAIFASIVFTLAIHTQYGLSKVLRPSATMSGAASQLLPNSALVGSAIVTWSLPALLGSRACGK